MQSKIEDIFYYLFLFFSVTSSEKVDKENRYSQFTILSLPYPGCEFFREFRDQNYSAENLYYNWSQTHVDAEIIVPQDSVSERVQIKWKDYKVSIIIRPTPFYLVHCSLEDQGIVSFILVSMRVCYCNVYCYSFFSLFPRLTENIPVFKEFVSVKIVHLKDSFLVVSKHIVVVY